jgi:hypothetical protein
MINDGSMLYAGSSWTRRGRFFAAAINADPAVEFSG